MLHSGQCDEIYINNWECEDEDYIAKKLHQYVIKDVKFT